MMTRTHQPTAMLFLVFSAALLLSTLLATHSHIDSGMYYQKIIHTSGDFFPKSEYDYIVVGGGTAGCPLASTLSEQYSVLLLERGGDASENPLVLNEQNILPNLLQVDDKNSAAETFVSEDGINNRRARILGGGSMINYGFYSRGDDEFYKKSGIALDMNLVNKSYEWVEETVVFRTHKLSNWQSSIRDALLESGVRPYNGYTLDHKLGTKVIGTLFDKYGRRHGASELLKKANPKNLNVVLHATVERIIFSKASDLSAVGVIYRDSNGRTYEVGVRAEGEVILSAGALGSPQLLLLSGVGPKEYLSSLNIPIILDQPFVGKFMVDNPRNSIYLNNPFPQDDSIGSDKVVGITKSKTILEAIESGLPFFTPFGFALFHGSSPPLNLSMVGIVTKFTQPLSKGSLKLASSTNASRIPIVRFNYFSNPKDLYQCVSGMRQVGNMLKTKSMERYMIKDRYRGKHFEFIGTPLPQNQDDDASMRTFCHESLTTFWHYHGGCLVNKVVDNHLKVEGIRALRVVDGSVFTMSPGTNPQATLMMLGRYIGLKIQEERKTIKSDEHLSLIIKTSL